MQTVFQKYLTSSSYLETVIFILLTCLSVYFGQTSIFYVIYFFWWNELICITVDSFFNKKNKVEKKQPTETFGSYFLMFIYGVFILVFFGLILLYRKKKQFTYFILGGTGFYLGMSIFYLSFDYFLQDTTSFDKVALLILITSISLHAFLMKNERSGGSISFFGESEDEEDDLIE